MTNRFPRARWLALALLLSSPAASVLADEFLPPEQAFRYSLDSDGQKIVVHWDVEPGYYLYLKRMGVSSTAEGLTLGEAVYPQGEVHTDEYFGEQVVFRGRFDVTVPITVAPGTSARDIPVTLKLQGCADAGLCYPPTAWDTSVTIPAAGDATVPAATGLDALMAQARSTGGFGAGGDEFLDPDVAFRLGAVADGPDRVRLTWEIAAQYYLYREKLGVKTGSAASVGQLVLPAGEVHSDEYFGEQEVYREELVATIPVARAGGTAMTIALDVTYQGCADAGLCYPPITKTLNVDLPAGGTMSAASGGFVSKQDKMAAFIRSGNLLFVIAFFFGAGLLLAFTPCVLPMVPILSGIIAGQGANVTTRRAFFLSLSYVLGMAFTYTLAGIIAAAAGAQVQAVFQQPWIVTVFALLFVVLALSMFGLFTIQMPAAIQTRLADASNRQRAGTFGGVAAMGALSALIVTTCVAPALVATLAVIGQSGNVVRGGLALFAMSLGMGAPLLAVGASAGKLLPKAGPWMDTVKQLFGVLFLLVAAWMLARLVPGPLALLLWAVPALAGAWVCFKAAKQARKGRPWWRSAGAVTGLYGVVLLAGAALGGGDPLAPIPQLAAKHEELGFRRIASLEELEREVAAAHAAARPVMLDFYADWCVSCKEMEKYTFTDPAVRDALAAAVLLQVDVTANNEQDQALLKHFGIYGPPTIAFYGPDGIERRNYRVVGYMKAAEFSALAREATAP
ncbi:MAG TPA: protein-disulfide reductase DsbD [Steroidobacteraceae bacterium]|nr:protein-disulfide reductase DsbD [Steroidobacteraceae bacterium]HNS28541.1 protein-disulfide reductase DsbD [Steroidobacteraceae bacterium]